MRELEDLQDWYRSQCDGDWEHQSGIEIDTLDNPGWSVTIDLSGTPLEHEEFPTVEDQFDDALDWLRCSRNGTRFEGVCGPSRLVDVLRVFLDWATTSDQRP